MAPAPTTFNPSIVSEVPQDGARGWHDRKLPDGEVPEKIKKISGWKRAMKTFMNSDPKFTDLIHLFTSKFVQLGQSKNFTLTTLMDMAWTVLILTWEAVIAEKLPMMDEVERGFKEKYEDLKDLMTELRLSYLTEITEHRDRIRKETLSAPLQVALSEISGDGEDHSIYRLQPELALDEKTQEYFKAAMIENLKIAMTKGANAAGETVQLLMAQLAEAEKELESLRAQLADALLQLQLAEGKEVIKERPTRRESRPAVVKDDGEAATLKSELEKLRSEIDDLKKEIERYREMLRALGIDPDASLDDIRKMLRDRNKGGSADADAEAQKDAERKRREQELLREKAELEKKIAMLEKQIEELKNKPAAKGEEGGKELKAKIKELQDEVKRLKEELEAAKSAKGDSKEVDELRKKNKDLENQLALLKKQLAGKGDSGAKDLLKRNEELEAEITKLNQKIEILNQELNVSKRQADGYRQELSSTKQELADVLAELEDVRSQLEEALEKLGQEKPKVIKREAPKVQQVQEIPKDLSGDVAQLQSEIQARDLKISKLTRQLKEAQEANKKLDEENQDLKRQLEEAEIMRKALEAAMEELRRKFEEFKKLLIERGVDVSLLDEALAAAGMPLNPMSVFDRLYMDALRRHRRMQEKQYIDAQLAQQESWERILGIHRGPYLTPEQIQALSDQGLLDIKTLNPSDMGTGARLPLFLHPEDAGARSQSPERNLVRARTANDAVMEEARMRRLHLQLDVVGIRQPDDAEARNRRGFAVVSEFGDWRYHHQLQRGEEPPEFAHPSANNRSRSQSPEATQPLAKTMPGAMQRSSSPTGAGKRTASPSEGKPKLDKSKTAPLSTEPLSVGGPPSVFEFSALGQERAPRPPPRTLASRSPQPPRQVIDENSAAPSPLMIQPSLPLQQQRPVAMTPSSPQAAESPLGGAKGAPQLPRQLLEEASVNGQKMSYVHLLPDPVLAPTQYASKAPSLPQISSASPASRGRTGSAGNGGLSRSATMPGLGADKPSSAPHQKVKAPSQSVLNKGLSSTMPSTKSEIMVTGVSQQVRSPKAS
mmetsp:Transcript_22130/g.39750  ORF Transcript_22130/g.39750 Transcript_22130/m.39750 type:complete len:1059 (+) Transcript_22130:52-3228(+)|eukprot:CAMPEP_0197632114 /NCGR_PEP_ID=MMETSP1338-20131121/9017_1 /TAXON_ID=43686 ORGANISM="Pelagodinium beii, Strain RCC1491" /NCGR_SAMPLE_ID=MMETSP1338 /ASSEMBLY_ACC=CAM_ASM_000754 /LENGTH=1058 /DNA_ID=CAMNT_0043203665 /DNA_START=51 /DNA_END=3227 /DNA_ORIENTATION=+